MSWEKLALRWEKDLGQTPWMPCKEAWRSQDSQVIEEKAGKGHFLSTCMLGAFQKATDSTRARPWGHEFPISASRELERCLTSCQWQDLLSLRTRSKKIKFNFLLCFPPFLLSGIFMKHNKINNKNNLQPETEAFFFPPSYKHSRWHMYQRSKTVSWITLCPSPDWP